MANYVGRNRSRIQRDLRKARKNGKLGSTDEIMVAYGNKRHQATADIISRARKQRNAS